MNTTTVRVSLRDVREGAFRALRAHGASNGEARTAAAMVLEAELHDRSGLTALADDLGRAPWSHTPVSSTAVSVPGFTATTDAAARAGLVLGSPEANRLLREGPLAVELVVANGRLEVVAVPCPVRATSLLDGVMLEIARMSGAPVAVVIRTAGPPAAADRDPGAPDQLRLAAPDGGLGTRAIASPASWGEWLGESGVLAVGSVAATDPYLDWSTGPAQGRARCAQYGLLVDAALWQRVYRASRAYLVPG